MKQDNWIAYLLLGLIGYTVALSLIYENEPNLANQINSTVIIGFFNHDFAKDKEVTGKNNWRLDLLQTPLKFNLLL